MDKTENGAKDTIEQNRKSDKIEENKKIGQYWKSRKWQKKVIYSGQLTFFICSIEMIKLLNRAWSSLHIASSVFSCMDSMTITTAWNQKSVRLRDQQNIVPDSPHTPVHGGNGVPPIPLGTWKQKMKVKIGLEEIEKLHKDPKWCQKLSLETWNWKVMKNIWSIEHIC